MSLDALTKLIEAASFTEFRTISQDFLSLVGLHSATYCDGPYDGGADFSLPVKGDLRPAVQISVEEKWKEKLIKDVRKLKKKYNANLVYFVSSRRIPEGSFESVKSDILESEEVVIVRYDNQGIASTFFKKGKIESLFNALGIDISEFPGKIDSRIKRHLGPVTEAVSALLIFGDQAKDMRKHIYGSLIKSELAKSEHPLPKDNLIELVLTKNGLSKNQASAIISTFDRLIQSKEILFDSNCYRLSSDEYKKFRSITELNELEIVSLLDSITLYLDSEHVEIDSLSRNIIVDNFLDLAAFLAISHCSEITRASAEQEVYQQIVAFLTEKIGQGAVDRLFNGLADIVANSTFAKHLAAAQLYARVLNSTSDQLVFALGGKTGVTILFDSSVAIPMLCGLIFGSAYDRFGRSSVTLHQLLDEHEFSGVIPKCYLEELAAHLIEACRDYAAILQSGEMLTSSRNAFVSHFSSHSKISNIDFADYVAELGVKLSDVRSDMSDSSFYRLRDKSMVQITNMLVNYGVRVVDTKGYTKTSRQMLEEALHAAQLHRPEVLIAHDAAVIAYLTGNEMPSDEAKILCTWDKIHNDVNPDGGWGYIVMNPVATIDLFAIAKGRHTEYPLSTLIDFAKMQSDYTKVLSDRVWDAIANIEKGNFTDGKLLNIARTFKEKFATENGNGADIDEDDIAKAWVAWKNTTRKE